MRYSNNYSKDLKKIRERFGNREQLMKTVEECVELAQAIEDFLMYHDNPDNQYKIPDDVEFFKPPKDAVNSITEEIADVLIMIDQVKDMICISEQDINKVKMKKINRTMERIDGGYYDRAEI